MATTPRALGDQIRESVPNATLFAPKIRYRSTHYSEYDPCMGWLAELVLARLDDGDHPHVLGGYLYFLTIRMGEESVPLMLDSLSSDADHFAGLFHGEYVSDPVQGQFEEAINSVLILMTAVIAEPLRGHDLGAWMAAEVISRMDSASDALVLLYPHPAGEPPEGISEFQAITALDQYWRKIGVVPIDDDPAFLGQSSAFKTLPEARSRLSYVEDVELSVDINDPRLKLLADT
jgi:hypothetical protein